MFAFETKPLFVAQASLEFMAILLSQPPGHRYDAIAVLYNVYGSFTKMYTQSSTMSPPVLTYVSLGILGLFPSLAFWDLNKTVKGLGQEAKLYEENSIQVSLQILLPHLNIRRLYIEKLSTVKKNWLSKIFLTGWALWSVSLIPATQEAEAGGST